MDTIRDCLFSDVPKIDCVAINSYPFVLLTEEKDLISSLFKRDVLLGGEVVTALPENQTATGENCPYSVVLAAVSHRQNTYFFVCLTTLLGSHLNLLFEVSVI